MEFFLPFYARDLFQIVHRGCIPQRELSISPWDRNRPSEPCGLKESSLCHKEVPSWYPNFLTRSFRRLLSLPSIVWKSYPTVNNRTVYRYVWFFPHTKFCFLNTTPGSLWSDRLSFPFFMWPSWYNNTSHSSNDFFSLEIPSTTIFFFKKKKS